ncbi:MAG TPA: DUF6600 domain-containing protein [Labilithrix sp.]|nr:DUF6600 domain-containing protein [Labilithrix sp.]
MRNRLSGWMTSFGAGALVALGLLSVGCGPYEPEPAYPQQYQEVPPEPPTAAELAAQQEARAQAAAASREVLIGADENEYADTDPSALTEFKPALEGHGEWINDSTYGTVWVPAKAEVGADFQPYVTAGHWTYNDATDYVWVSDYSWGWAPFHYGRWVYLSGPGWAWIPGRRYSGAWVTWRVGPAGYGYLGWAPAPPSWYWYDGVAYGWSFGFYHHHDHYVYCPHNSFYQPVVATYVVRGSAAREHHGRTKDYVPSRPAVGGADRVLASPTVNGGGGRVVANPTVRGPGDRVVATPELGGRERVPAKPGRGPRPDELGLKNEVVVAPPKVHDGLGRAQALATPSTAMAAGAAPPVQLRPSVGSMASERSNGQFAGSVNRPAPVLNGGPRAIAAASPPPSVSTTVRPTPPPVYRESQPWSPAPLPPRALNRDPAIVSSGPRMSSSTPAFRSSPPAVQSTPSFRSSVPSPSFRSTPPAVRSTPSFRSSVPSPSFRSSAPAVRSTPSFRSSSSVRSTPTVRSSGIRRR